MVFLFSDVNKLRFDLVLNIISVTLRSRIGGSLGVARVDCSHLHFVASRGYGTGIFDV